MTHQEFQTFLKAKQDQRKISRSTVLIDFNPDTESVTPDQAFSVRDLMIRQSLGLPMPNLTPINHLAYNGFDALHLPASAHISCDLIDATTDLANSVSAIKIHEKNKPSAPKVEPSEN